MRIIPVKTTYLEMRRKPSGLNPIPPMSDCFIMRAKIPTVAFYRFLYGSVGKNWLWVNRLVISDEELK